MAKKAEKYITLKIPQGDFEKKLSSYASGMWSDDEKLWALFDKALQASFKRIVNGGGLDGILEKAIKSGIDFNAIVEVVLIEDTNIKVELRKHLKSLLGAK